MRGEGRVGIENENNANLTHHTYSNLFVFSPLVSFCLKMLVRQAWRLFPVVCCVVLCLAMYEMQSRNTKDIRKKLSSAQQREFVSVTPPVGDRCLEAKLRIEQELTQASGDTSNSSIYHSCSIHCKMKSYSKEELQKLWCSRIQGELQSRQGEMG